MCVQQSKPLRAALSAVGVACSLKRMTRILRGVYLVSNGVRGYSVVYCLVIAGVRGGGGGGGGRACCCECPALALSLAKESRI